MDAENKWYQARDILNANPNEEQLQEAIQLLQEAVAQGHAGAHFTLAQLYQMGFGVEQDLKKSYDLLCKSLELGYERAKLVLAKFYIAGEIVEKDIKKAETFLRDLAGQDDMDACYSLATNIMNGTFSVEDENESTVLLLKAAQGGEPNAQYVYGRMCCDGMLADKDKEDGLKWIESSASQNQRDALFMLACSYLRDTDIYALRFARFDLEQDAEKGFGLLCSAAQQYHSNALYILAKCYQIGKYVEKDETAAYQVLRHSLKAELQVESMTLMGDFYCEGIGTEQNYELAFQHYKWAAENGGSVAYFSLASLFEEGKGVEKNDELAQMCRARGVELVNWDMFGILPLEVARENAKNGDSDAMYQLGLRYKIADGVDQNIDIASDWWLKAAMKGHIRATHELGLFYLYVKQDIDNALKWLTKSANEGYGESLRMLGEIYINGSGVEVDTEKGLDYITQAAEKNHEDSQLRLAHFYMAGEIVERDKDKAKYWFEKYLVHDSADSHYRLGLCLCDGELYDRDYQKALEQFTIAVKRGCHEASPYYISMLWNGVNATPNRREVIDTFSELADNNDAVAAHYMYELLKDDQYEDRNEAKAIEYLKKSAELGYGEALMDMGGEYLEDGYFGADFEKANEYFAKAADSGNTKAMVNLAISYQYGRGLEKDVKKALEYYQQAAEGGEQYAAREAARILLIGADGEIEADYEKGLELLEKYAIDDAETSHMLSIAILHKLSLPDSYSWELASKAAKWMEKSSLQGNIAASYRLAGMYMRGEGVIADTEKSKELFSRCITYNFNAEECKGYINNFLSDDDAYDLEPQCRYWISILENNISQYKESDYSDDESYDIHKIAIAAASCGEPNAMEYCGLISLNDSPKEAEEYILSSIKKGNTRLALSLGNAYIAGKGVETDLRQAAVYLAAGAELENVECMMSLALIYKSQDDKEFRDAAKELYMQIISLCPEDSSESKYASYCLGGMIDAEIKEGRQLEELDLEEYRPLYFCYAHDGRFKDAGDAYVKLAEQTDTPEVLASIPVVYALGGEFEMAYEIIEYCENNLPDANMRNQKAMVDMLCLNDEAAMSGFDEDLLLASDDNTAGEFYVELLNQYCEYEKVIDFVTNLEVFFKTTAISLIERAKAYDKTGQKERAKEELERIAEMPITSENAFEPLHALVLLGKENECRELIESSIETLDATYEYSMCIAYIDAAYLYCLMGDKEEAVSMFYKAVSSGYVLFDYLKAYYPELMEYEEIKEYIEKNQ